MSCTHLVTGATGFIGGALILELLRRTDDQVIALVRPGTSSADQRFMTSIEQAIAVDGAALDMAEVRARCRVIAGDIAIAQCGVEEPLGRVDQMWHCAASLRYENRFRDEIRATNVEGTRHALDLARRVGIDTFNYMSTAYVAGRTTGEIRESIAPAAVECHNHYERSKVDAEQLVADATGLRWRILRPSVVVGHSRTLATRSDAGFYGFVRQLLQFRGMMERTQQGLLEREALAVRLDPDAPIDLVAVDRVAQEAVRIGLSDATGVFHLTSSGPPTVGATVSTIFEVVGLHAPRFVASVEELDWLGARFDRRLEFYGSYLCGERRFDRSRTDAWIGRADAGAPVCEKATLVALARSYLATLTDQRTNMPVAR